ncbi:MAG: hypothetical protein P4L35_09520 [Ignavibacteriaceae bacterium]|nr:hypothetical protein [Ignavibacteriaceae bacterium]
MKNNKECPKCNSNEILKIPGTSGNIITTGSTFYSAVRVTRYICCDCGYSEEWVVKVIYIKREH